VFLRSNSSHVAVSSGLELDSQRKIRTSKTNGQFLSIASFKCIDGTEETKDLRHVSSFTTQSEEETKKPNFFYDDESDESIEAIQQEDDAPNAPEMSRETKQVSATLSDFQIVSEMATTLPGEKKIAGTVIQTPLELQALGFDSLPLTEAQRHHLLSPVDRAA